MRFYEFNYSLASDKRGLDNDPVPTPIYREWFGSERDAVVRRMELFIEGKLLGKKSDNKIWPTDIDTSKSGLLAYLQTECV